MLSDYLRYEKSLTGTKVVCAEGDCGACSVLRFHPYQSEDYFIPINSCLTPLLSLHACSLVTVDQLAESDEKLHPVQKSMLECHGSQCGFCTPGFVMSLTGLVEEKMAKNKKAISDKDAKNALTGNLCRCTGYEAIIKAATSPDLLKASPLSPRFLNQEIRQDLIKLCQEEVELETKDFALYAPLTINRACSYLEDNPQTRILGAATDLGVLYNKKKIELFHLLSLHQINELYEINLSNDTYYVGARATVTAFRHFIKKDLPELATYLDLFASPQIKNIATVVGNIANASPIGDLSVAFLVLEAKLHMNSISGTREVPLSDFYQGYKKIDLSPGELITGISFTKPSEKTLFKLIKNSNRKDLDISTFNFALRIETLNKKIIKARLALGGVAATPIRLKKSESFLESQSLTKNNFDQFLNLVQSEFNPLSDLRGSEKYRRLVIRNYFARFFKDHQELLA
jgi:xanthine dehydrogenase small subunit